MIKNAMIATPSQFEDFKARDDGKPIYMLNLLKFNTKAVYKDGKDAHLSGQQAYQRYAEKFVDIGQKYGVEFVFSGAMKGLLIGEGECNWDSVVVVRYPDIATMIEMTGTQAYKNIHTHRRAGLEGQLLIQCDDMPLFGDNFV